MKTFHIITGLKVGGAETMLKRLIESDPSSISDTVVVSLTSMGDIGTILHNRGVTVHALGLLSPLHFPVKFWLLIILIRRYQPQIIQTWMYHADLIGGLAARLAGYKNIVWGIRMTKVSTSKRLTVLVMKVCASLSHWLPKKIICVAESAKLEHKKDGYDATRMIVVHNGFDFARFTATSEQRMALREFCHFSEDDLVIGSVGRFHFDKGQDNFIKAAAIVARDFPAVKFLMVGRDCDANNARLITWLNDYGLTDRFTLLSERDDVPACLASMDIFCMPSRTEGFPNSLGEAMSMALPCVATNVGDAAILAADTVIFVPPQNEQALALGLIQVLNISAEQRRQMGLRARERVSTEFTIEKARARYDAVYQQILENI